MAGVPLASAFVRVRPDVDKAEFEAEARAAGEAAGKEFGEGFSRDSAGRLRNAKGDYVKAGEEIGGQFGDGFTKGSDGKIGDGKVRFVKGFGKTGEDAGDSAGRGFSKKFGKSVEKGLGGTSVFATVAKIAASRIALIGLAAGASVPGILNLTAALLPAAGALVQFPVAITAVKAATATLKIAVAGVSDAISAGITGTAKQAEKALKELPPAARDFAKSIIALKPQIESLRASVSQRFFLPLSDDIKPLAQIYFPLLRKNMSNLAGPLGGLGEQLAETARKGVLVKAVTDVFTSARLSAINLRGSLDPLVTTFARLISSTAGNLPKLAQGFTNLAQRAGAYATKAIESGKVNAIYQAAVATLRDLGGVLLNVLSIVRSVFVSATAGSGSLLANLRALTGEVAKFLQGAQGMGALSNVFGVLAKLGAAIRTLLGGVLPQIAIAFQSLGPAIGEVVGPAADLVVAIGPLLPAFGQIAAIILNVLTPAIQTLANFLNQHNAVVKAAAAAVLVWVAVQRTANAVIAVSAAGGLLSYLKTIKLVTAATKVWSAVQIVFNTIMDANPIVLTVLAIAALVAGVIYAYKHFDWFRKVVDAAWGAIKVAIKATVDWIVNVAWPALKATWNAIAAAALWLWHNVFEPVWHGIMAVVNVVVKAVRVYIQALVAEFKFIASIALWLWHNIFGPVFSAIRKIVEVWWLAVQIIFKAISNVVQNVVGRAINGLKIIFSTVFNFIKNNIVTPWWNQLKATFNAFRTYILGPIVAAITAVRAKFVQIFTAISAAVRTWWVNNLSPIFAAVRRGWDALAAGFSAIYNNKIKPLFNAFVGFIRNTVVGGFRAGVAAITAAWDRVREAARKPVAFVVTRVINPFIRGLNTAASLVGVKNRVKEIPGFQAGGQIPVPGFATGGRITGAPSSTDNRLAPARIPGVGAVKLAGGEYVVNAADTRKALPLLQWINKGMKGGTAKVGRMLGKPLAEMPGDGSEGWAFADGGLVGWTKDVWGALTNPTQAIRKPFEALLAKIPGSGMIKEFLLGSARKFLSNAIGWITGSGSIAGSATDVAHAVRARTFVQSQAGKPYVWASAGPGGYDCSGIVSAAYNILKGGSPYRHTFSTGSLPGPWFDTGRKLGTLMAGWSHPGQSPASASVGHMAGQIAGMPFESTGSTGVRVGSSARRFTQFANTGAARATGGLIDFPPIRLFDNGGVWPSGTLGANLSGRTEYVDPNNGTARGSRTYQVNITVGPGAHPVEVGRQTVQAIKAFERANGTGWRG